MSFRNKRVLVTGADGFVGSHLAEALVQAGADVRAFSLYNAFGTCGWLDTIAPDIRNEIDVLRGDIRDAACVNAATEGVEFVFHLAALIAIPYSYEAVRSYVDVNVHGTVNVLESARSHGVARIVHTSTSEVYGTAQFTPITEAHPLQGQSPYSASKIGADMMAEAYAKSFELPVVILRPFNTYGPRQSERAVIPSVIRQALDPSCSEIRIGDTTPKRDFTYVADTVDAFLKASAEDLEFGLPYNCGTGIAVTIGEAAEKILAVTGCNKPLKTENARFRPEGSEVRELLADATRFTDTCGWRPATSFEAGIEATVNWWRARVSEGSLRPDAAYLK